MALTGKEKAVSVPGRRCLALVLSIVQSILFFALICTVTNYPDLTEIKTLF